MTARSASGFALKVRDAPNDADAHLDRGSVRLGVTSRPSVSWRFTLRFYVVRGEPTYDVLDRFDGAVEAAEMVDAQEVPRFAGVTTFMRRPHARELEGVNIDVAFLGVPYDDATSYWPAARFGPPYDQSNATARSWWRT